MEQIASSLANLGASFSFKPVGTGLLVNRSYQSVSAALSRISDVGTDDVLLIYYYGHSTIEYGHCVLAYSDLLKGTRSQAKVEKCSLYQLVRDAESVGFEKIAIILDCCHSGEAAGSLAKVDAKWALLASTGSSIQFEGSSDNPFTKEIARILKDAELRKQYATKGNACLSLSDLEKYLKSNLSKNLQHNPSLQGKFTSFPLAPVSIKIEPALNALAPKRSIYKKLFKIGHYLSTTDVATNIKALKRQFRSDDTFLVRDATGKSVMPSDAIWHEQMELGRIICLWEASGAGLWKSDSTKKIDSFGARFNEYVVQGILTLLPENVDIVAIRRVIRELLTEDVVEPTSELIHAKLIHQFGPRAGVTLELKTIRNLFKLLSYSRVLTKAGSHTYFIP